MEKPYRTSEAHETGISNMKNNQGYMKRNRKRDANEKEIIAALEEIPGCAVYPMDKPVDLLVGYNGVTHLIEVKNPEGKNRIEKDQREFFDLWSGRPAEIARSVEDAYQIIGFTSSKMMIFTRPK